MGIRVYDSNEMLSGEDCSTCCSCSSSQSTEQHIPSSCTKENNCGAYKDIVGNCKEILMDTNTCNLRIVGNNNRIKISMNMGILLVIGNNTRLKIQSNHGLIKYTGNDGRISLGIESTQQYVNYIGCNGTLKIVKSMKFSKNKSTVTGSNSKNKGQHFSSCCCGTNSKIPKKEQQAYDKQFCGNFEKQESSTTKTAKTSATTNARKSKEKSHSYGGQSSCTSSNQTYWHMFNTLGDERKKSLPNLQMFERNVNNQENRVNPSNIKQTIGDIVIANASNICISPQVNNFITAKAH
ncbi:poor Imd response upon knock-in [Musca autumnalis]|uniref:poor Imd response upon knock-in n=1 Tax=Musca autumnalis TaxID=221902 RepID=UPI003CFB3B41